MLEGVAGVGICIGLMGGSVVYEKIGYMAVFLTFGFLLLSLSVISRILFFCIERKARESKEESLLAKVETEYESNQEFADSL